MEEGEGGPGHRLHPRPRDWGALQTPSKLRPTADCILQDRVPLSISGIQAPVTEGGTEQTADAMEALSAAAPRGRVPWQGLLLAGKEGTIPGGGPEDGGRGCLGLLGRTAL